MGAVRDIISNYGPRPGQSGTMYLAGVIQGEARTPQGQFAVASTIYNRSQSPGFPSDPVSVAAQGAGTRYPQFSGYQAPGANAITMATAAQNGTLGTYGNTGNALYYNAKGNNAAYDSGPGYDIGGNSFSDQYNKAPSSNFVAPQYGGEANTNTDGATVDQTPPTFAQSGGAFPGAYQPQRVDVGSNDGTFGLSGPNYGNQPGSGSSVFTVEGGNTYSDHPNAGLAGSGMFGAGQKNYDDGTLTGRGDGSVSPDSGYVDKDGTVHLPDIVANKNAAASPAMPQQQQQQSSSSTGQGTDAGAGMPIVITDVTSAGSIAGQAISTATQGAGSAIQQGATTAGQAVQSGVTTAASTLSDAATAIANAGLSGGTDWLVRGALILLALVLLAGAFVFFTVDHSKGVKVVPIPV